ncbi:MAG: alpha/beta fold hydrolase [Myxococcota bacterium]
MIRVEAGTHTLALDASGTGPPDFVCIHGLVDTLRIWDRLSVPLAERGRVVRLDQRGHGRSTTPPGPYRREDLAGDVRRVLDAENIERAILIGHSLGGIVAMTTALAVPDRVAGLVLLGTASHCNERTAGWYERIAGAAEADGLEGLARSIYGKDSRRRIDGDPEGIAHVTRTLKSLYDDPLTPKLSSLLAPALLIVGEKDPMGPRASEIIRDQLPLGTLEVLSGLGHWTHVEAPELVIAALDRWLETHRLGRGHQGVRG